MYRKFEQNETKTNPTIHPCMWLCVCRYYVVVSGNSFNICLYCPWFGSCVSCLLECTFMWRLRALKLLKYILFGRCHRIFNKSEKLMFAFAFTHAQSYAPNAAFIQTQLSKIFHTLGFPEAKLITIQYISFAHVRRANIHLFVSACNFHSFWDWKRTIVVWRKGVEHNIRVIYTYNDYWFKSYLYEACVLLKLSERIFV